MELRRWQYCDTPHHLGMPELPEVEDAARRLRTAIVGKTVLSAQSLHPSIARSLTQPACSGLVARRAEEVARRGKIQLVRFDDGRLLEVHFRMTGDWAIGRDPEPPPTLERARFVFDDGTRVSYVDGRAFGVLRVHQPGAFRMPELGPEPLDESFDAAALAVALRTRRGPIKPVLLDQRVVAGLGNIYAAEALWEAGIRPDAPANRISRARVARLRDSIRLVLQHADGSRYFERDATWPERPQVDNWRVYDREGEPCRRCSSRIARIVQSGRSTYSCRNCQR